MSFLAKFQNSSENRAYCSVQIKPEIFKNFLVLFVCFNVTNISGCDCRNMCIFVFESFFAICTYYIDDIIKIMLSVFFVLFLARSGVVAPIP